MVSEHYSMGTVYRVFDCMKRIIDGNMALFLEDQHLLYYHMDAYGSIIMPCSDKF